MRRCTKLNALDAPDANLVSGKVHFYPMANLEQEWRASQILPVTLNEIFDIQITDCQLRGTLIFDSMVALPGTGIDGWIYPIIFALPYGAATPTKAQNTYTDFPTLEEHLDDLQVGNASKVFWFKPIRINDKVVISGTLAASNDCVFWAKVNYSIPITKVAKDFVKDFYISRGPAEADYDRFWFAFLIVNDAFATQMSISTPWMLTSFDIKKKFR